MKKKKLHPGYLGTFLAVVIVAAIGLLAVSGLRPGSAGREALSAGLNPREKAATINVSEGSGWLSAGEEIQIAEWYSGLVRDAEGYFANFRGTDGASTVDLRFTGLTRIGTFACGSPEGALLSTSVELWVDVRNTYRSGTDAGDCRVTVTRIDGDVMEGHYTARLVNSGDAGDDLTISGDFRATRPVEQRVSAAGFSHSAEL